MTGDQMRQRMQRALDCGGNTHALEDVVGLIRAGHAQFWEAPDGAAVTEIIEYPRAKILRYWLLAGRLDDVLSLEPTIERWAVEQGCGTAIACGRRGWAPIVEARGWRPWLPQWVKPLAGVAPLAGAAPIGGPDGR